MANTVKKKILAIDDHPTNLKVLNGFVDKNLFDLTTANNAEEAIRLCNQQTFDLVLMDIQLPGMNGIEATKVIRILPNFKTTPIVGLTADAFSEIQTQALNAGMNEVMTKPLKLLYFRRRLIEICGITEKTKTDLYDKKEALRITNGDTKMAKGILCIFINQLGEQEKGLFCALESKDLESIYFYAHKIHSAVCYCAIPILLDAAKKAELLALDKNEDAYSATLQLLKVIKKVNKEVVID